MSALEALLEKIRGRKALVGVIGLGYVGLPLALRFSEAGFRVLGFDTDTDKVRRLNAGTSYLRRFPDSAVRKARDSGFEASGARNRYAEPDALILCVPTPLNAHREPDLSFVLGSVEALVPQVRQGQIVSLESTTYPGTTEEELRPRIEARGLRVGEDVFLCFSPEREDPGNPMSVTRAIPKICAGSTAACLEAGLALYGAAIDRVVPVSSTRAAEMTKLLENIHRAVNIGLVNEMKIVADRMGLDIHEIIRAAATKPFGFVPYLPGPGLGGHCIPVDPFYLTWKAREYGFYTEFIELAGKVNENMPYYCRSLISQALNHGKQRSLKGSKVLVLGVAYKSDIGDTRESPALKLMELLRNAGSEVSYHDPHVPELNGERSVALEPAEYDCVAIVTAHGGIDYDRLVEDAQLVVDFRNATGRNGSNNGKVWKL